MLENPIQVQCTQVSLGHIRALTLMSQSLLLIENKTNPLIWAFIRRNFNMADDNRNAFM